MTDLRTACVLLLLLFSGCRSNGAGAGYSVTRFAMGTVVEYTVAAESSANGRRVVDQAHGELERVSQLLWEGDSTSVIFRLNRIAVSVAIEPEVEAFLRRSQQYSEDTNGAFDVTIGGVLALYKFKSENARAPNADSVRSRLESVGNDGFRVDSGGQFVKIRRDVQLAVGGVAKGYGVDRAIDVLRSGGVTGAIVNAGGDLYALGMNSGRKWRVGIRDPDNPSGVVAVLQVSDEAVATSGDYQQFFVEDGVRYHHILDPKDGWPAGGIRSATVIAATTEEADALATAAFVLGPEDGIVLLEELGVEGLLIDGSGESHATSGLSSYLRP